MPLPPTSGWPSIRLESRPTPHTAVCGQLLPTTRGWGSVVSIILALAFVHDWLLHGPPTSAIRGGRIEICWLEVPDRIESDRKRLHTDVRISNSSDFEGQEAKQALPILEMTCSDEACAVVRLTKARVTRFSSRKLTLNAALLGRFARPDEDWPSLVRRVASLSGTESAAVAELIDGGTFVPGGQILRGAGNASAILYNSYVVGADREETAEGIAQRITAWTRKGCGIGINITPLLNTYAGNVRSALDDIVNLIGYSQQTLWAEGVRRTATMLNLEFGVPGIPEISRRIAHNPSLRHLNIGVILTDAVLEIAARPERSLERTGLQALAQAAWECGNPGLIFTDRVNKDHPFPSEVLNACNSCAEQFLLPNEGAPLGSVNLPAFVEPAGFDFSRFRAVVRLAVRFLNDVIDATAYPSDEARALAKRRRRIGLGVMGYDTALRSLGLSYDTGEALALGEELAWHLADAANEESRALARLHGPFDDFPFSELRTARRNCALLSLAPTGESGQAEGHPQEGAGACAGGAQFAHQIPPVVPEHERPPCRLAR